MLEIRPRSASRDQGFDRRGIVKRNARVDAEMVRGIDNGWQRLHLFVAATAVQEQQSRQEKSYAQEIIDSTGHPG